MSSRLRNMGEFIKGKQINLKDWYLEYKLTKGCFIDDGRRLPWKHIFLYSRQNVDILKNFLKEHCLKSNLLQLSHNMFCKNVARLAIARERIHVWQPPATAKRAIFLQNILWESFSKFYFNVSMFLKKISQNIDTLARIHGNVFPWQPAIMGNKASR